MRKFTVVSVAMLLLLAATRIGRSETPVSKADKSLRLLNTSVFGWSTNDAIILLKPKQPSAIDPETVMVDINNGRYFAATVTYPKEISFSEARRCLNSHYGKWEKPTFANDPTMGLWRNEDDQLAIEMTENGDTLQVIDIEFSLVSPGTLIEALGKAAKKALEESEPAAEVDGHQPEDNL